MNIAKMMQQAKAMQGKMQDMEAKMADMTVEGASGGGLVKITLTCKGKCRALDIDSSLVKVEEKEVLEDLVMAAINDARTKGEAKIAEETQKMVSDLGLPPGALGGGLPF